MSKKPVTNQKPKPTPQKVQNKPWRAEDYVTPNMPLQQVMDIKGAFDLFDVDKSGSVDARQLKNAFVSLGFASSNKFVYRILQDYQSDGVQGLSFAQFLKFSAAGFGPSITKQDVDRVFKHFDLNKTGKISAADMKKVAQELNENLTQEEIEKMVAKADSDGDGLLTSDDIYTVLVNMNSNHQY